MSEHPVGAEARGKRRLWKTVEAARFAAVCALFKDREIIRAGKEFARRNGRHSACSHVLCRFDRCAHLELMDLKARPPIMCWSAIDAALESPLRDSDTKRLNMEERQATSSIFYVMTAKDGALIRGLWSSSYTDHATGRLLERWPTADISKIIRQGHDRLLLVPDRHVPELLKLPAFVLPTDQGGWWCSAAMMQSVDTNRLILHFRARSWIDRDQIRSDQLDMVQDLLTMRAGDRPLGRSLLHPFGLRGLGAPLVEAKAPAAA